MLIQYKMYEIKEVGGKFRLYNSKTKTLLKPVYKKRETALKNMEKKNCVSEINEKFQKPKKPKKINLKVEKAKTYGKAVIVEPKLEMKKAKEFDIKVQKAKTYGKATVEGKDDLQELRNAGIDMWSRHYEFRALWEAIDAGIKKNIGKKDMLYSMPVYVERAMRGTMPLVNPIPASLLNRISKMMKKPKEETKKMIEALLKKTNGYMNPSKLKKATEELKKNDWKIEGYFKFVRNDKDDGFNSKHSTWRGYGGRLAKLKKETDADAKKYFELVEDYFEEQQEKKKPKPKTGGDKKKPKKHNMSKDVAGIVSELTDPSSVSKRKWKELIKSFGDAVEMRDYFYAFQSMFELGDNEGGVTSMSIIDRAYDAADPHIYDVPDKVVNKIMKIVLKNKKQTKSIIKDVISAVETREREEADEDDDFYDNIINNDYEAAGYFKLFRNDDNTGFENSYQKNTYYTDNVRDLKKDTKKEKDAFLNKLVEYFEAKANALRTKALIENI